MASWQDLTARVPSTLKRRLESFAKAVWLKLGNDTVHELDDWWHSVKLSYIAPSSPQTDPSPKTLILNLIEGESDYPSKQTRYSVDFVRERIKINFPNPGYAAIPDEWNDIVRETWEWAKGIPVREEQATQARQAEAERVTQVRRAAERKRREAEDDAAAAYEERLGLKLDLSGKRKHALGSCQVCGAKLVQCSSCSIYSCPIRGCTGAGTDVIWQCSIHPQKRSCSSCRSNDAAKSVGECLSCHTLLCLGDFVSCRGEVIEVNNSTRKKKQIHPPRRLVCPACYKTSSTVSRCHNAHCRNLNSKEGYCQDCVSRGTFCSHDSHTKRFPAEWWCSRCAILANPTCPTCSEQTCTLDVRKQCFCGKIDSCESCADPGQSDDEEELEGGKGGSGDTAGPAEETNLVEFGTFTCPCCEIPEDMCEGCMAEIPSCDQCYAKCCVDCVEQDTCRDCGETVCAMCAPGPGSRSGECPQCCGRLASAGDYY